MKQRNIPSFKVKTKELLLYLLRQNPKSSITSLMKLAYLVDLISVKKLGKQISEFKYKRYYYGPFDKKIYSYIEKFVEKDLIVAESDYGLTGEEFAIFSINPDKEKDLVLMYWRGTHFPHFYTAIRCPECDKYNRVWGVPRVIVKRINTPENRRNAIFDGFSD